MMKKLMFALASFCIILSLNSMAQQRGQRMNPEERIKQTLETLKKEVKLNDNQVKEVENVLKESNKKRQEMFQNNRGGDREAMREKMQKMQEEENAAMKKVLTEEQFKAYTAWQEKQRKEMEQRRNERGGQRGPANTPATFK